MGLSRRPRRETNYAGPSRNSKPCVAPRFPSPAGAITSTFRLACSSTPRRCRTRSLQRLRQWDFSTPTNCQGSRDALEAAVGAAEFFARHVPQTATPTGAYFGYLPGDRTPIHNASMLVCALFARLARLLGRDDLGLRASAGVEYTVSHQRRTDLGLTAKVQASVGWTAFIPVTSWTASSHASSPASVVVMPRTHGGEVCASTQARSSIRTAHPVTNQILDIRSTDSAPRRRFRHSRERHASNPASAHAAGAYFHAPETDWRAVMARLRFSASGSG